MLISPYDNHDPKTWPSITRDLVNLFPLSKNVLIDAVETAWDELYRSSFGESGLRVGRDIFLPAQATGILLERLIAVQLNNRDKRWRAGKSKTEKDIVFEGELKYSFEIKTSSSKSGLYGNRSTGHRAEGRTKFRTGYYLVVNYKLPTEEDISRNISNIRFGWIDDSDWVGQAKPTGQQASIGVALARLKLITIKGNL